MVLSARGTQEWGWRLLKYVVLGDTPGSTRSARVGSGWGRSTCGHEAVRGEQ